MKILVVDDDRIARKVLRAFLEDAKYEVVVAEDGKSAIDLLLGGDAPPLVILDWVMPGMSGPEVCAKLRASRLKTRPYVLMLSAKTDKAEVVAGLDAGADDFLSKPFNLGELLARLRVAQRMIEYEFDLAKKIAEYESLEQRHQLLGELISTSPQSDPTHAGGATTTAPQPHPDVLLSTEQLSSLAASALEQFGVGPVRIEAPAAPPPPFRIAYAAWSAIISVDEHRWLDLMLEAEPAVITRLIDKALHHRANASLPKHSFLAEALTIIGSAVRTELRQRTCDTIMPFLSRGMYLERHITRPPIPEDARSLQLDLDGHPLRLTVVEQSAPMRRKVSNQLRLLDVLAEAYPPPQVNEVPLLNRGAILNDRYIEKLTSFAEATSEQHPIPVYIPTPLATFFHREGLS